jgi:hypothetical protein
MEVGTVHKFHKLPFKQFHNLTDLQPCFQNQQQSQVILFLMWYNTGFFSFKTLADPNIACIVVLQEFESIIFLNFRHFTGRRNALWCSDMNTYFCRYIFGDKSPWKYIWVLVVLGSNIIAGFFIFTAATDFTRRSVPPGTGGQCRQGLEVSAARDKRRSVPPGMEVSAARDWRSVPPGTGGQCRQGWRSVPTGTGDQCCQGLEVSAITVWSQCHYGLKSVPLGDWRSVLSGGP